MEIIVLAIIALALIFSGTNKKSKDKKDFDKDKGWDKGGKGK